MNPTVIIYRIGNYFHEIGFNKLGLSFSYINRLLFSAWIPSSAKIGEKFQVGYWGLGIVIHSNTIIGNNCLVCQNVTIGRNFGETLVPVIGKDVYIGAGSVIFGEITIGNNVIIGANSLINKSIPDNCTVAGNPYKILEEGRILKYYELDNIIK